MRQRAFLTAWLVPAYTLAVGYLSPAARLLLVLRPFLHVGLVLLIGWLLTRLMRGRLGNAGKALLLFLTVILFYSWAWTIGTTSAGQPLRIVTWAVVIGGTLVLVKLLLRLFPFPVPYALSFVLVSPLRRLLLPAELVLDRTALGPGMRVVEVGPGTGFLTFPAAKRLEPGGVLCCVDVEPRMIGRIQSRVEIEDVQNVRAFVAPAEKLPEVIYDADLVFYAMVLGEVKDKRAALAEAMRVLKPGGVLSVTEAIIDPHYLTRGEVRKLAEQAGFMPWQVAGNFWSYTASFRKPGQFDWRKY